MPSTTLGFIDYPAEGDTSWYTTAEDGIELWLERAELLGIPTYDTFADLPAAGTPASADPAAGETQRQFAAVVDEKTIYRVDDAQAAWVPWMGAGTSSNRLAKAFRDDINVSGAVENEGGHYAEAVNSQTGQTGTVTIDLTAANIHEVAATGAITIDITNPTNSAPLVGNSLILYLSDGDGTGPHSIDWTTNETVEWPNSGNDIVSEIPASSDVEVGLYTPDGGSTWRAAERGSDFST